MDTMAIIEPIEIVLRLLVVAIVTSWTWLFWRLLTGQPVLPEQPLVARRAPPWHFGTVLLVFLTYVFVSLFVSINYPLVAGLLPQVPPVPAAMPQAVKGEGLEARTVTQPADGPGKTHSPAAAVSKVAQRPPVPASEIGPKAAPRRETRRDQPGVRRETDSLVPSDGLERAGDGRLAGRGSLVGPIDLGGERCRYRPKF